MPTSSRLAAAKRLAYQRLPHRFRRTYTPFTEQVLERGVIFVHIPKTGGSSLKQEIYGGPPSGGHRCIAEFLETDPERTREFFKCAFVRNPWDRLLSAYSYLTQGGANADDQYVGNRIAAEASSFETFVLRLNKPEFRRWVMAQQHFRDQAHWICLPGETGHSMDFLGHFESMGHDLAALRTIIGPAGTPRPIRSDLAATGAPAETTTVLRSRDSLHAPYQDVYTEQMRDVVADVYSRDIDLLGYRF